MIPDTTSEAEALQHKIINRMSGKERLLISMSLSDKMRDIVFAGLKRRHPQAGEEEIHALFYREIHRVVIRGTDNGK